MVSSANDNLLKHKVGASEVAVSRGAATRAFDTMNYFLHYNQMYLVGGTYWNMVYGKEVGEVLNDAEGMNNMKFFCLNHSKSAGGFVGIEKNDEKDYKEIEEQR